MKTEYTPLFIHCLNVLKNYSTAIPYVPYNRRSVVQQVDADCNDCLQDKGVKSSGMSHRADR